MRYSVTETCLAHIKIWGCPAYVKRIESDKLGANSDKCLFMEYPKGYNLCHSSEQNCLFQSMQLS